LLTNVASKSLEAIMETVAPKETLADQTGPTPKPSFPVRVMKAYMYFFMLPIRLFLCPAEPLEDDVSTEATPPFNDSSEKTPVAQSSTSQPVGDKAKNDVGTLEEVVGNEPVHPTRAVPVAAF